MFQFPRFLPQGLCVQPKDTQAFPWVGFPIRASPDITPDNGFPRLIAVVHALLQLMTPRHPPYALSSFPRETAEIEVTHSIRLLR